MEACASSQLPCRPLASSIVGSPAAGPSRLVGCRCRFVSVAAVLLPCCLSVSESRRGRRGGPRGQGGQLRIPSLRPQSSARSAEARRARPGRPSSSRARHFRSGPACEFQRPGRDPALCRLSHVRSPGVQPSRCPAFTTISRSWCVLPELVPLDGTRLCHSPFTPFPSSPRPHRPKLEA